MIIIIYLNFAVKMSLGRAMTLFQVMLGILSLLPIPGCVQATTPSPTVIRLVVDGGTGSEATTPSPAALRLVDGSTGSEGRIEIYYHGNWGTICDDNWTIQNGHVACRELGYREAMRIEIGAIAFGEGTGSIWLDDVICQGDELSLAECANRGWGVNNCQHSEDVGVVCSTERIFSVAQYDLQLIGGPTDREGRLQIYHDGRWGSVCDDAWTMQNAYVACRQLGFTAALELEVTPGQYGDEATGPIFLDNVVCTGSEAALHQCAHTGWGVHDCSHNEDVTLACAEKEIRLVGGSSPLEGRVEILYDGLWGSVCDDGWDLNEAMVVCRELGYEGALGAPTQSYFGQSEGHILLDQVECGGQELRLTSCRHEPWGVHNCLHTEDAGVICQHQAVVGSTLSDIDIRLVEGTSKFEGRVEVFYEDVWGTICDDQWSIEDGQVVCRQLGFGNALSVKSEAFFGHGDGPVLLDELHCSGTEVSLAYCKSGGWTNHDCGHAEDAGVICDIPPGYPTPALNSLRLVGGDTPNEGRIEIRHDGKWGSICDDGWDLNEANVACRNLGYEGAVSVDTASTYGEGTGEVWLDDVICDGTEAELVDCSHSGWGVHDCSHSEDVGVVCIQETQTEPSSEVIRLVDGSMSHEGRVEVYISGIWGTICARQWDLMDATVVCHQLGFGNAKRADGGASFGQGSIAIIIDNVQCAGNEAILQDCAYDPGYSASCDHGQDAGVVCSKAAPSSNVRLIGGFTSNEGRVEVFHEGIWGTICDSNWDDNDARVVCRQLGFAGVMSAKHNAFYGQGIGSVLLANVGCTGEESELIRCLHPGWYEVPPTCTHGRDAGVMCEVAMSDGFLNIRLSNANNVFNTNEGRVEVYHHGSWGTVCGRKFDLNAASVVCRQLGFPGVITTRNFAFYGQGSGEILLSDVDCTGNEAQLGDCTHSEGNVNECTHADDAGVLCIDTEKALSFTRLEIIISGAILVVIIIMALALAVVCCRCRGSRTNENTTNQISEEERRAIQMRNFRGRQSSIPNEYASAEVMRRSTACASGISPYESVFPQAEGGKYCDGYEPMEIKIKAGYPEQPPPYTSPCATPVCSGDPPEYPPPPSPRVRQNTLSFKAIPPVHEADEKSLDAEHCIYQEVDDYLVPESNTLAVTSIETDFPSTVSNEDKEFY